MQRINWALCFLISCSFWSCQEQVTAKVASSLSQDSIPPPIQALEEELALIGIEQAPDSSLSYQESKQAVRRVREELAAYGLEASTDSVFTDLLVNQIFPYWYGTAWSFEGHTSQPGKGEIACGYFVSTTLLHLGLQLNRYRLAQQLPIHEAKSLAIDTSLVLTLALGSTNENIEKLYSLTQEGIYFIGFDASHVGFLLNKAKKIYLIHSNYLDARGVLIERIEESEVFASYERFHLVPISGNPVLLSRWLRGEELAVITE